MTASYLFLDKLTPHSVPCHSLFWEEVRWHSRAWWDRAEEAGWSGLSCPTSAIPVGWGLQKLTVLTDKTPMKLTTNVKASPTCSSVPADSCSSPVQPGWSLWLSLCSAPFTGWVRPAFTFRLSTPPVLLPASPVVEAVVYGWEEEMLVTTSRSSCCRVWSGCDSKPLGSETAQAAPPGAVWSRRVLSRSPWHPWKLVGLAFICTKAGEKRGRCLMWSYSPILRLQLLLS